MPHTKESALRELKGNLSDEQIKITKVSQVRHHLRNFSKVFVSLRLINLWDYEESDRCKRKGKG